MDLDDNFELIVIGTGVTESLVSAAASRAGHKVLHLDTNDFYGREWTSFTWRRLREWIRSVSSHSQAQGEDESSTQGASTSSVDQSGLIIIEDNKVFENIDQISYLLEVEEQSPSTEGPSTSNASVQSQDAWLSMKQFDSKSGRFNVDLAPNVLFARGPLVELLISSNMSRYLEFKAVSRILTHIDDRLRQVPSSRSDIFNSTDINVVEKRSLMKFMQTCNELKPCDIEKCKGMPFKEFMVSNGLRSEKLMDLISNAIAMVPREGDSTRALDRMNIFLSSLGRFSNSPFLFPLYGCGELPQAFCRLSAVFGGIYYLKAKIDGLIRDENCIKGIMIQEKKIECRHLVLSSSLSPFLRRPGDVAHMPRRLSRAILVSKDSILRSSKEELSFLRMPHPLSKENEEFKEAFAYLIEVGEQLCVAPKGLMLTYIWCESRRERAKDDLVPYVSKLFSFEPPTGQEETEERPRLLWALYYNQLEIGPEDMSEDVPCNMLVTSTPTGELDYFSAIDEARGIFDKLFPGEEFLPRAPDPEEIVFDSGSGGGLEVADMVNGTPAPQ